LPKVLINVRVDVETLEILKEIADGKGEKYLSSVIREAIKEYIASYTGELTLKELERRVSEIDKRLRRLEDLFSRYVEYQAIRESRIIGENV